MISHRYRGLIKLHFLLKQLGGLVLFWLIVWLLHLVVYRSDLLPANYVWVSFLVPAAAVFEVLVREERFRSLGGLSRAQIWSLTQREILFALVAIFGVIVMSKDDRLSRVFLASFFCGYALWISWMNQVGHRLLHNILYRRSKQGTSHTSTVVLAPPREIEQDSALRMTGTLPGADFLGYVNYGPGHVAAAPSFPVLGEFGNLREICRQCHARLLLALGLEDQPDLVRNLQQLCDSLGMRLIWVDDKRSRFKGNFDTHRSGSQLFLTNWQEPLEDPIHRLLKRSFDLVFSFGVVVTVLPLLCLGVKTLQLLFSPGPLFYRQKRTGRNGEVFEVFKFRTMHLNDTPAAQAKKGDPRIYPGAAFLRKASLDEFPQFLNVLTGDMSVVGPRPHFIDHDLSFAEIVRDYPVRHFAKPGITGLAQVRGCRGETDTSLKVRHRVRYDHFYLRHWSLLMDVCIISDTVLQVVFPPRNAR